MERISVSSKGGVFPAHVLRALAYLHVHVSVESIFSNENKKIKKKLKWNFLILNITEKEFTRIMTNFHSIYQCETMCWICLTG